MQETFISFKGLFKSGSLKRYMCCAFSGKRSEEPSCHNKMTSGCKPLLPRTGTSNQNLPGEKPPWNIVKIIAGGKYSQIVSRHEHGMQQWKFKSHLKGQLNRDKITNLKSSLGRHANNHPPYMHLHFVFH